jgi:hypothetical protein
VVEQIYEQLLGMLVSNQIVDPFQFWGSISSKLLHKILAINEKEKS